MKLKAQPAMLLVAMQGTLPADLGVVGNSNYRKLDRKSMVRDLFVFGRVTVIKESREKPEK